MRHFIVPDAPDDLPAFPERPDGRDLFIDIIYPVSAVKISLFPDKTALAGIGSALRIHLHSKAKFQHSLFLKGNTVPHQLGRMVLKRRVFFLTVFGKIIAAALAKTAQPAHRLVFILYDRIVRKESFQKRRPFISCLVVLQVEDIEGQESTDTQRKESKPYHPVDINCPGGKCDDKRKARCPDESRADQARVIDLVIVPLFHSALFFEPETGEAFKYPMSLS